MKENILTLIIILIPFLGFSQEENKLNLVEVDTLLKSDLVEEKKTDLFNNGLFGLGNATKGGGKINPQTNIRSLRYTFNPGKDTTKILYLVIRHSISNLSFELNKETNIQKVAIESIGSEILNSYGGLFSLTVGDKEFKLFKNGNEKLFKWEVGAKSVAMNKSVFSEEEENNLSLLFMFNGFAEYDYSWKVNDGKKNSEKNNYIAIHTLAGFTYTPIFDEENIYFNIFQDERGNSARTWGFTGSLGIELKLQDMIISAGILGRFPDSRIFGMKPRWYLSISNNG